MAAIPDNLTGTERYEAMEGADSVMTDALMELSDIEEKLREI